MKTIIMTSGKSGVGVSSTAAAVCMALAKRGRQVLLCEMSAGFRSLNIQLGLELETLYDISDVLNARISLEEAAVEVPGAGYWLVQGASEMGWLPRTDALQALLESTGSRYDYLLMDCPAGTGELQSRIAPAADLVILLTTPQPVALAATAKAGEWWEGRGALKQKVIFNQVGRRLPENCGFRDLDEALDRIGASLLGVIPPEDLATSAAICNIAARLDGECCPLLPVYLK